MSDSNTNTGTAVATPSTSDTFSDTRRIFASGSRCKLCGKPVRFDDRHRTNGMTKFGKIYFDTYFDAKRKTDTGEWIPLDIETGMPHQCPQ